MSKQGMGLWVGGVPELPEVRVGWRIVLEICHSSLVALEMVGMDTWLRVEVSIADDTRHTSELIQ